MLLVFWIFAELFYKENKTPTKNEQVIHNQIIPKPHNEPSPAIKKIETRVVEEPDELYEMELIDNIEIVEGATVADDSSLEMVLGAGNNNVKDTTNNMSVSQKKSEGLAGYIYFDVETTGLYAKYDEILQLSIIDDNNNVLYDGYFKPKYKTSWPEAQRVNHISPVKVKNSPRFEDELERIQAIISSASVALGYNVGFDRNFLQANGITFEGVQIVDVLAFARKISLPLLDRKLVTVASFFGFDYSKYSAHNSLTDVLATKFVFDKLKERNYTILSSVIYKPDDIRYLNLSSRVSKILISNNITTIADLLALSDTKLKNISGIGPVAIREIHTALSRWKSGQ